MRARPANISTPPRCCGLSVTATTLVALVAMTATVAGAPAPRGAEMIVRPADGAVVRAVAAAVAAVARDLAGAERSAVSVARLEPAFAWRADGRAAPCPVAAVAPPVVGVPQERLIDLPPPQG